MLRWLTIALAVLGLAVGVWAVSTADPKQPQPPLARPPSVNPFAHGVAALGMVEPASRSIAIAPPESGLVTQVLVNVGDVVAAGQPLFRLDARRVEADLVRAQAAVGSGEAEIARWNALPRAEDIPPLEAAAAAAQAVAKDREEQEKLTAEAVRRGAGTERDLSIARYAAQAARADLERANADLAKLRAGGWRPDLAVAQANLARLRAEVQALTILRDRLTVTAPVAGTILRRDVEPGEQATTDAARPPLVLGDLTHLNVRAQVDEEDIALVRPEAQARARTRGAVSREIPLRLLRIEPFARPKTMLSGDTTERTDTRVIEVVLEVAAAPGVPLYPGQAVDVFIDTAAKQNSEGAE